MAQGIGRVLSLSSSIQQHSLGLDNPTHLYTRSRRQGNRILIFEWLDFKPIVMRVGYVMLLSCWISLMKDLDAMALLSALG